MLASFEFGDAFLSLLWLFFLVIFFWLLITVFSDLFRDHDLSGWAKAAWILFVVILPFLGILVYLIARSGGMQKRALAQQKAAQDPHLVESGFWQERDHPTEGRLRMSSPPMNFGRTPASIRSLPPRLGEHSEAVLREAGIEQAVIDSMFACGEAVAPGQD